ncbi:toxin-activating lysine-acyltransferase [Vogesella amnigena]|uniref:RTX toxin-activating lysine-acyltransferase n=1 Tax=Vogesella amnigena TaxID=1507449 RepID=A0ABV7TXM5_9NEIS
MIGQQVLAPALQGGTYSEATVLGAVVWLWMHSASHRRTPLMDLQRLLLPAIKSGQFILVTHADKPVFYLSWAQFSPAAEARYLQLHPSQLPETDWQSGDRMWVLDWVAPFGHSNGMRRLVQQLFATRCWRGLYHKGNQRGLQVKAFSGLAVLPVEARAWQAANPVCWPADNTQQTQRNNKV